MAREDSPRPTESAATPKPPAFGGLKGLQAATEDSMAQELAFELNTGRAGEYALKAVNKLPPEKLALLISEAKAAKAEVDAEAWSTLDYLRSRYTAPVAIAYETRPVLA